MKLKKTFVSKKNPPQLFEVIRKNLALSMDTQIFVSKDLIDYLKNYGHHNNIFTLYGSCLSYTKCFENFNGETWFHYHENGLSSRLISSAAFKKNSNKYYQLIEFPNNKLPSEYINSMVGLDQILLIESC